MKKQYTTPAVDICEISRNSILAGSIGVEGEMGDLGNACSKDADIFLDDFPEESNGWN